MYFTSLPFALVILWQKFSREVIFERMSNYFPQSINEPIPDQKDTIINFPYTYNALWILDID